MIIRLKSSTSLTFGSDTHHQRGRLRHSLASSIRNASRARLPPREPKFRYQGTEVTNQLVTIDRVALHVFEVPIEFVVPRLFVQLSKTLIPQARLYGLIDRAVMTLVAGLRFQASFASLPSNVFVCPAHFALGPEFVIITATISVG